MAISHVFTEESSSQWISLCRVWRSTFSVDVADVVALFTILSHDCSIEPVYWKYFTVIELVIIGGASIFFVNVIPCRF